MEEAFESLKSQGKDTVDELVQWMKDAKIIDGTKVKEDQVRAQLKGATDNVELDKFKEVLGKLAKDSKKGLDELYMKLCNTATAMDEAYNKMKNDSQNTVDNLVKWLKESKIIGDAKDAEDKARKLFDECQDKGNVEIDKFKEIVGKLAAEQHKNAEDLTQMLAAQGPKILTALTAAASAFKESMNK